MTTESPKEELTKSAPPLRTVLLVDDWDDGRIMTKLFLTNFGYAVDCARSGEEALLLFDPHIHDAVLTDNNMSGMTGAEMAHIIKIRSPNTPVVMYSGAPPDGRACLDVVIQKPAHLMLVKQALDDLLSGRLNAGVINSGPGR
jgi:CheY-like chemotaxis protein